MWKIKCEIQFKSNHSYVYAVHNLSLYSSRVVFEDYANGNAFYLSFQQDGTPHWCGLKQPRVQWGQHYSTK